MLKLDLKLQDADTFYAIKLKAQEALGTTNADRIAQALLETALGILIQSSPDVAVVHERFHTLGSVYEDVHDYIARIHAANKAIEDRGQQEQTKQTTPLRKEQVN